MTDQTNQGAVSLEEEKLDQVAGGAGTSHGSGGGTGKVSMNDRAIAGDPSQWGKKGSFDITG